MHKREIDFMFFLCMLYRIKKVNVHNTVATYSPVTVHSTVTVHTI